MKQIIVLLMVWIGFVTANTLTVLEFAKVGNNWKVDLQLNPPVVVEKVIVSNEQNSSEADFVTDLDTTLYFLIDTSIPMKLAFRKGVRPLLAEMERIKNPKEKWVVAHFDSDLEVIYDDEKGQLDSIERSLKTIKVRGQRTELWRNVQVGIKELSLRSSKRKVFVLLSDGNAEDTTAYTRDDVIKMAEEAHIRIVSLSYRDTIGTQNMRKISEETGGYFQKADKKTHRFTSGLQRDLIKFVRSQGLITIPSSLLHATKDGKETLRFELEHDGEKSRTSITVDTDKIIPPKPKPTAKPARKPAHQNKWMVLYEKYTNYVWAVGVPLVLFLLFLPLFLRKKPDPEAEEIEPIVEEEGIFEVATESTIMNDLAVDEHTRITPVDALAYFETLDGKKYDIFKFPSTIGKSETNDLVIPGKYISRQHATITQKDDHYYIIDNNSSNGVKVNGRPVGAQEEIFDGTKVGFGPFETVFRVVLPSVAANPVNSDTDKTRFIR